MSLDNIIEYLKNPMKTGVFNCQITLDLSETEKLYEFLLEQIKTRREKAKIRRELREAKKETYYPLNELLKKFYYAVYVTLEMEECPKAIEKFYDWQMKEDMEFGFEESVPEIFSPTTMSDLNDVLSIDILKPLENETEELWYTLRELGEVALDITSVKKEGVMFFVKFLEDIPLIGKTVVINKDCTETHSSRYSFRPYATAVGLWLEKEASKTMSQDLRKDLAKSSEYYTSGEWRTSIVLSAITAESLLADLYEEEYHKPTPSKATLGELFEYTRKKVDFPKNIAEAIQMTNNSRISAVHRSRFPVSDREAVNALYGTTNFSIWYFSRFQPKQ